MIKDICRIENDKKKLAAQKQPTFNFINEIINYLK